MQKRLPDEKKRDAVVPSASVRQAVAAPAPYGCCAHLPGWLKDERMLAAEFAAMKAAGIRHVRYDVTPRRLRGRDGALDFTAHDRLLAAVEGVGHSFLTRIQHIDPDMNAALAELKSAIENEVWQEWCEALSACQYDRSLKTTLNPIVAKLSEIRIINGELENLVFGPRKEFIAMAALVVLNIPLLYFLNKDWYATLMMTYPGKVVLAVCAAAIFVSFARVVKLTQPIEYRR